MAKANSTQVYQLKITLAHIKPPIWRRVQVKDCTLSSLHAIIQIAMGWAGFHLWVFEADGRQYGEDDEGDLDMEEAHKVKLSQFVQAGVKRLHYIYDFGDHWDHNIQIEKVLEADPKISYPHCVKGERACPPEDCGGPLGYPQLLEIIQDPHHDQHEEMLEWVGGDFDPDAFDLEATNQDLQIH